MRAEADHRVANSLQTISSLLRITARGVADPEALAALELVDRRLTAVASLHSQLMEREEQGAVGAKGYLDRVASFLRQSAPANTRISVESVDADLSTRVASSLGMIASEFVANSIKYAFPDDRNGAITIELSDTEDMRLKFHCEDNGIGHAAVKGSDAINSIGLGSALIEAAAAQLNGQLTHQIDGTGSNMTLLFNAS